MSNAVKYKSSSHVMIALGAVGLCGAVGVFAWWMGRVVPPPADAPAMELVQFASSDVFVKLPADQKKPYLESFEKQFNADPSQFDSLTEEQREIARRNIFGAMMEMKIQQYLGLKSQAEKNKFLDDQLNEMQKRMLAMAARKMAGALTGKGASATSDRPPMGPPRNMTPQQQKNRIESTNSLQLAAQMELFGALRERAISRGIPMPGPFK